MGNSIGTLASNHHKPLDRHPGKRGQHQRHRRRAKSTTGTLDLAGINTWTGSTTASNGTLQMASINAIPWGTLRAMWSSTAAPPRPPST